MNSVRRTAALAAMVIFVSCAVRSQTRLLDEFETLAGWKVIVSEGAKLSIGQAAGKTGQALAMEYDLSGVYGYVLIQKEFPLDLPDNYQFTFDMKADAQVNNFEFKVIDERENVYWIKKLNVTYPKEWTRQRITKGRLVFAWGPNPEAPLVKAKKIELVVSCGTGGKGKVFIDNFRFESIDEAAAKSAVAEVRATSNAPGLLPRIDARGTAMSAWRSTGEKNHESLTIDFHRIREVGGVVIDWDTAGYASSYDVLLSDDGAEWFKGYSVQNGNGGRDYVPLKEGQGRFLRFDFSASSKNTLFSIRSLTVKEGTFSSSANAMYRAIAADAPAGYFPKYFQDKQSYWTVVGVNGDTKEALINEQGQIEVDKLQFSLEPFLYVDGKLMTWSDMATTPSLLDGYLPIPSVTWAYGDDWRVTVQAVAAGVSGNSLLGVKYSVQSLRKDARARLFIAIRPFQVNPPWQALNTEGGVSRVDSIVNERGLVHVNDMIVIPMTNPSEFGATSFDQGDVTEYLARGIVPPMQNVHDHAGYASGALAYDMQLRADQPAEVFLAVPFHAWRKSPVPSMGPDAGVYYRMMLSTTAGKWKHTLDQFNIALPPAAQEVVNTVKSQLAYIFINRDGPGIQPGSRSYERSWIRDGSLTSSALLRTGNFSEVREFLDWYATGQFPSGKIPCVMDQRGPDAVPEHDSHGEFIYAINQYFRFSRDTTWLRGKFDAVVKTVRYMQSLRAERKTDEYKNGTPEQRALYGLVPQSISHEGYSAFPRHSYWDDFFVLRGLKDAVSIAVALGQTALATEFSAERDDFRKDLYGSMRQAMVNTKIDYIPGCAELGDFDATSTTIGLSPGGELGNIPEPQLHNTFDKYWSNFVDRQKHGSLNYTPYETRVIGSFVMLGQKERAEEAVKFFMNDRRPHAWNHWAEVVWPDPETPKFIGDMPHTWVGSDFVRSILTMFWYEREHDDAIVLAGGIPDVWIKDPAGIRAYNMLTPCGEIGYSLQCEGSKVTALIIGTIDIAKHAVVVKSPLSSKLRGVKIDGKKISAPKSGEVKLARLPPSGTPVKIEFIY